MRGLVGLLLAAFAAAAATAQDAPTPDAPDIALALTEEEVRVDARFAGARIIIYGVAFGLEADDDVVVTLRGPAEPLTVMRKERTAGIWLNGPPARIEGPPSFYAAATTRPLNEIAPPDALRRAGVSADVIPVRAVGERAALVSGQLPEYRRAIVRLKRRDGLYAARDSGVEILDAGLFRATVEVPAGAPTGVYRADAVLFRDGRVAARRTTDLVVARVGLERAIYDLAHERPFLYGLLAVVLAVAAGFAAAAAFQRR